MVVINHEFSGIMVMIEINDCGFVNVTNICRAFDKRWASYLKKNRKDVVKIATFLNVDINDIVKEEKKQSTFAHPSVFYLVGKWINKDFGEESERLLRIHNIEMCKNKISTKQYEGKQKSKKFISESKERNDFMKKLKMQFVKENTVKEDLIQCKKDIKETDEIHGNLKFTINCQRDLEDEFSQWDNNWKTIYEIFKKEYKVYLSESQVKKIQKAVVAEHEERWKDVDWYLGTLYTQKHKWELLTDSRKSINPIVEQPCEPTKVPEFKSESLDPNEVFVFHKRDWDLVQAHFDDFSHDDYETIEDRHVAEYWK